MRVETIKKSCNNEEQTRLLRSIKDSNILMGTLIFLLFALYRITFNAAMFLIVCESFRTKLANGVVIFY